MPFAPELPNQLIKGCNTFDDFFGSDGHPNQLNKAN